MARPKFAPDAEQRTVLDEMSGLANERLRVDARMDELIAKAGEMKIPIDHIAKAAKRTRKTVYRHLGRRMK